MVNTATCCSVFLSLTHTRAGAHTHTLSGKGWSFAVELFSFFGGRGGLEDAVGGGVAVFMRRLKGRGLETGCPEARRWRIVGTGVAVGEC